MQLIKVNLKKLGLNIIRFFIYMVLGWFVLAWDPFGMASSSDKAFQDAYINLSAPFYDESAQDDIAMVAINDQSISYMHEKGVIRANSWPLVYKDHATILKYILESKPRAIFVDVYFKDMRATDPTFKSLQGVIRRAQAKGIPLLFAQGYEGEELTAMQEALDVNGGLAVNGWAEYHSRYALKVGKEESIAYKLYRIACLGDKPLVSCSSSILPPEKVEADSYFAIDWGDKAADVPFSQYTRVECEKPMRQADEQVDLIDRGLNVVIKAFKTIVGGLFNVFQPEYGPCLYHPTIPAEQLVDVVKSININQACSQSVEQAQVASAVFRDGQELCDRLSDKIVIYTIDIEAATDKFVSPVHGTIPGAYRHAMALDNLIVEGEHIKYKLDDAIDLINLSVLGVLVFLFMVLHEFESRRDKQSRLIGLKDRTKVRKNTKIVSRGEKFRNLPTLKDGGEYTQKGEQGGHAKDESYSRFYYWGFGLIIIFAVLAFYHFIGDRRYEAENMMNYVVMVALLTEMMEKEFGRKVMQYIGLAQTDDQHD